jgi:hypothetical protein
MLIAQRYVLTVAYFQLINYESSESAVKQHGDGDYYRRGRVNMLPLFCCQVA